MVVTLDCDDGRRATIATDSFCRATQRASNEKPKTTTRVFFKTSPTHFCVSPCFSRSFAVTKLIAHIKSTTGGISIESDSSVRVCRIRILSYAATAYQSEKKEKKKKMDIDPPNVI